MPGGLPGGGGMLNFRIDRRISLIVNQLLNLLRKGFCFLLLQKVIADMYSLLSKRVAVLLPAVIKLSQGMYNVYKFVLSSLPFLNSYILPLFLCSC